MSIAMQNEIDALKAKVKELETKLSARAAQTFDVVKADWDALVARIENLDAQVKALLKKSPKL